MQLNFIRLPSRTLMWSVAALALAPAAAVAAPPAGSAIPVLICEGWECPEGYGLLGDATAREAEEAEADLGSYPCEGEGCEPPPCEGSECEPPPCEGSECEPPPEGESSYYPPPDPSGFIAPEVDNMVESLQDGIDQCGYYDPRWRIDCLAMVTHRVAQSLPSGSEYDELRTALARSGAELRSIATANADAAVPPARLAVEVDGKTRTSSRALRAVAPARQAAANAAASAALDSLTTTLLRSASTSTTQRVHFERAVEAVNSAKVLLRSA